jgi:carbon storage regulator
VLVLTRKTEQGIIIDGHTLVRVLAVDGERVKLGIEAPAYIAVLREELVREVEGANREAAEAGPRSALMERLRSIQDTPRPDRPQEQEPPTPSA